jgi:hypothetical protein
MADTLRDYDEECDVMYITIGEPTRDALSFEDENGLIWRQSPSGEWIGVTIPDYRYFWGDRETELQRLLSARLPEPVSA